MLATCVTEIAEKGALGVLVGLGVRVGGTRENGVSVKRGVNVGRGVLVGVISNVGLAVQVGSSLMGEGVAVGTKRLPPGGKGFRDDVGFTKINAKYPTIQAVKIKTMIERMSHVCMDPDRIPLNKLLIYITPLFILLRRKHHICYLFLLLDPIRQSQFLQ